MLRSGRPCASRVDRKAAWPRPFRPDRYKTWAKLSVLCGNHEMHNGMEAVALCGVPGA
jgi:hypothetical protein